MLLTLSLACDTAPYSERMTYRRSIVRLGYPVEVREDYSLIVAGKRLGGPLRRTVPASAGEVEPLRAYDNTRPMPLYYTATDTATLITLGEGCLPPGRHRITLFYRLYPRRGTLRLNVLNGDFPVPVDYIEVLLLSPDSSPPSTVVAGSLRVAKVPGFPALRLVGDGPYDPDRKLDIVVPLPKAKGDWRLLPLLLLAFLLHAIAGPTGKSPPPPLE